MAHSDLIVIWGGNPVNTQVNVMTHVARARKARGARLVVVDPYRTGTAEQADVHLALRPGTDGALACAVMHVLFRDGHADRAYLARYADDWRELEAHLRARTPEWAARITGLPVAEIEAFAQLYGTTKRSYLRLGYGFTRSRNGAANMHAASCLPVVTGAWQYEGGGALCTIRATCITGTRPSIEGLDVLDPAIRMLDQSRIGPILAGDRQDLGDGPPVTALLIQNTNPMCVAPELDKVHEGFAREDLFVCVHEQFMTETARMADIVLPATHVPRARRHLPGMRPHAHPDRAQAVRAVCRLPDQPLRDLRAGAASRREASGFRDDRVAADRRPAARAPAGPMPRRSGRRAARRDAGLRDGASPERLPTPTGKFQFKPDWAKLGPDHARMPKLPDHFAIIDETDDERPFRLVAAPARNYLNTSFTETPTSTARKAGRPC